MRVEERDITKDELNRLTGVLNNLLGIGFGLPPLLAVFVLEKTALLIRNEYGIVDVKEQLKDESKAPKGTGAN